MSNAAVNQSSPYGTLPTDNGEPIGSPLYGTMIPDQAIVGFEDDLPQQDVTRCHGLNQLRTALDHLKRGFHGLRQMTIRQILGMILGVMLVVVGNTGQLLAVNEWMALFTNGGTAWLTALTLVATVATTVFGMCFGGWCLIKRPNLRFLRTKKALRLIFVCGFGNATNGVLIISATPHTPEILQAFLFSTTIFWTFLLMKLAVKDDRSYVSPLVIISFLFSLGGIVAGSASQFSNEKMTTNSKIWTGIFAAGMLCVSIYNVFVYKFMNTYSTVVGGTLEGGKVLSDSGRSLAKSRSFDDETTAIVESHEPGTHHVHMRGSVSKFDHAMTVKLAMLFTTGVAQTIFMWCYVPLDAVPWFGTSKNIHETYVNLGKGYACVFGGECGNNLLYGFLFCFFYIFNYFGTAYLNSYSAAVTSMVTQLGSPIAALTLLVVPKWNVSVPPMPINVGESIAAVFLLVIGSLLYTAWEESTRSVAVLDTTPGPKDEDNLSYPISSK